MIDEQNNEDDNVIDESMRYASKAKVIRSGVETYTIHWKNKKYNTVVFPYPDLPKFLCDHYQKDEVTFLTEYNRGGFKYRCHPNFYNNGAYYDWMRVLFEGNQIYPCKLIACVPGNDNDFEGNHLIVQCADKKGKEDSILFHDYIFSTNLVQIDAGCCDGPCFVVDMDPNQQIVCLAVDKEKWPGKFTEVHEK